MNIRTIVNIFIYFFCFIDIRLYRNKSSKEVLNDIQTYNIYGKEQIIKALYIGSLSERKEAKAVLNLAEKAFRDVSHTRDENLEQYGLLSRYATSKDEYCDVSINKYSLKLWSAHLDEDAGWIWVHYSSKAFDQEGKIIRSSQKIPSL